MKRFALYILPLCLSLVVAGVFAEDADGDNPFAGTDGLLVIAHQGGDGLRPGNTMSAFEYAVELGVDVLEMDIHSTADGVMVAIHDDTVDRTSDGSGAVNDFTLEELLELDFGYAWPTLRGREDEDNLFRGEGVTIATVEEVLQAFPDYLMNIEIKQIEPSITEPLCEMIREYEMTEQVLVASFHLEVIVEFREVCPEVRTSAVEEEIRAFLMAYLSGQMGDYETDAVAFQVPESFGGLRVVTPPFVQAAQERGIAIHVWTVNEAEDMERMIEMGVDGIITDYPDVLLELLERGADDE